MRAWLDILRERHPGVKWIVQDSSRADAVDGDHSPELVRAAP